jgi:hypothetical protein
MKLNQDCVSNMDELDSSVSALMTARTRLHVPAPAASSTKTHTEQKMLPKPSHDALNSAAPLQLDCKSCLFRVEDWQYMQRITLACPHMHSIVVHAVKASTFIIMCCNTHKQRMLCSASAGSLRNMNNFE